MSFKPPRLDPKKMFVMKHKDRDEFVCQLTPMLESPHLGNARRFDGKWLNDDTCWKWWTFHTPIDIDSAFALYGEKAKPAPKRANPPVKKAKPTPKRAKPKKEQHGSKRKGLLRLLKKAVKRR